MFLRVDRFWLGNMGLVLFFSFLLTIFGGFAVGSGRAEAATFPWPGPAVDVTGEVVEFKQIDNSFTLTIPLRPATPGNFQTAVLDLLRIFDSTGTVIKTISGVVYGGVYADVYDDHGIVAGKVYAKVYQGFLTLTYLAPEGFPLPPGLEVVGANVYANTTLQSVYLDLLLGPPREILLSLPGPKGYLNYPGNLVGTGFEFNLPVYLRQVTDLYALKIEMTFDPNVLEVIDADSATPGTQIQLGELLLGTGQSLLVFSNQADNVNGLITFAVSLNGNVQGVTGSGNLAYIPFRAKGVGNTSVRFTLVEMGNSKGQAILPLVQGYNLMVWPGATIAGKVDVPGREVPAFDNSGLRVWVAEMDYQVSADASGAYRLVGLPTGFNYTIRSDYPALPSYFTAEGRVAALNGDSSVNLALVGGDAKTDGIVDIFDVVMVTSAFDSVPNHARWNKVADLNGDGHVDITDLVLTTRNFNSTGLHLAK